MNKLNFEETQKMHEEIIANHNRIQLNSRIYNYQADKVRRVLTSLYSFSVRSSICIQKNISFIYLYVYIEKKQINNFINAIQNQNMSVTEEKK